MGEWGGGGKTVLSGSELGKGNTNAKGEMKELISHFFFW